MTRRIQAILCALRSALSGMNSSPFKMDGGVVCFPARQYGKTIAMQEVILRDAVKIHVALDGRTVAIHRTPDKFTDRCKITVTRQLPYCGNPILQKELRERFPSVNAAMRYAQFVLGITEWNVQ